MRWWVALASVSALSGCMTLHSASSAPVDRRMPPSMLPKSTDDKDSRQSAKRVNDKEAPVTLVAGDASRCTVSEEQFRVTRTGDSVTCEWKAPLGKPKQP